ncbi:MAG: type 2 isopentenyl-diphosphate Delta-isomerase [Acidilobus sp.]
MGETTERKLEHIETITKFGTDSSEGTLLDYVRILHRGLPNVDLNNVDLSKEFCGKTLRAPIMITGMTGGHPASEPINAALAEVAEKYGLAIGVGSQRAGIEDPSLARTYSIVREKAPTAFVVANLGAAQLSKGYGVREALRAVEMIKADAIAIHLNPGQEAYQDEGDPYFAGVLAKIEELVDQLPVPVIVKEVGTGLSREDIVLLSSVGVKCFDVAGLGGTSWIKVEAIRSAARHKGIPLKDPGPLSDHWGNPTAIAVIEAREAAPWAFIVGSGGVRSGLDAAKVISIGADVAGLAAPALRALAKGRESLQQFIDALLYQLKTIIYMTGGTKVEDLWRSPVSIWGRLKDELEARGLDVDRYLLKTRLETLLWRKRFAVRDTR